MRSLYGFPSWAIGGMGMIAYLTLAGCSGGDESPTPSDGDVTIHYYRPSGDYSAVTMLVSGDVADTAGGAAGLPAEGTDEFGAYFHVGLAEGATTLTLSFQSGGQDDVPKPIEVDLTTLGNELWTFAGDKVAYNVAPLIPEADQAIIYYVRPDGQYEGWGLHVWKDTSEVVTWQEPLAPTGSDAYGIYWTVGLTAAAEELGFIIHSGDTKDPGPDQSITFASDGYRVWRLQDDPTVYTHPVPAEVALRIDGSQAQFVSSDTIAWDVTNDLTTLEGKTFTVRYLAGGGIQVTDGVLVGGERLSLTLDPAGLSASVLEKFPQLSSYEAFKLAPSDVERVKELLKGQLVAEEYETLSDGSEKTLLATGLQLPGVLDELYAYDGELGVSWNGNIPTIRVWAPTALSVTLRLFDDATISTSTNLLMTEEAGVWSIEGQADWKNKFYLYDVELFVPSLNRNWHNQIGDPYAVALSTNSFRTQIVDLNDAELAPDGWTASAMPALEKPEDISIYELHVRDFSIGDTTVPDALRGTWKAFTQTDSNGMKHLQALANAGLTHVHLLPTFDIASVNEDKAAQLVTDDLSGYAADSEEQQAAVALVQNDDGFNWGYDPYYYSVPEGGYAVSPNGSSRTLEFREMVKSLHENGLRVVMDVVYNHTSAAGQSDKSVLDKIVPGYYYRLDAKGNIETSTCCQNTASEHKMMEKLLIDSVKMWAQQYHVDGFRFDLMGHHMKSNMLNLRAALDALTPENSGIDGSAVYLYGEGWNFGEVANDARGVNATQLNMAGTGIGTFNDRLRDAVRGGGPFDNGEALQKQGFASGLHGWPNAYDQGSDETTLAQLLLLTDQIKVGLTGNLRDYSFEDRTGEIVTGADVPYNGAPTGYTLDPQEAITYVEAHDNQTLFDIFQYKLPAEATLEQRVRAQVLGASIVALGQGIPFFHAGMEILRSKSLDRDSYNSGDWFNKLDFSYADNNYGKGLPMEAANGTNWELMAPLLADTTRKPSSSEIMSTAERFEEFLAIRSSSRLFRLGTAAEIQSRLEFLNNGPEQLPGLIVMSLSDDVSGLDDVDPDDERILVFFNGNPTEVTFFDAGLSTQAFALHPIQQESSDPDLEDASALLGSFTIPALSTVVFVNTLL